MRTAVIAHLAICLLALFGLAGTMGPAGIWLGLGVAAILAAAIPFVILPASAAVGFLLHWIFHRTQLSVSKTVTITVIICEVALLGWLVFFILLFAQG